MNMLKKIVIFLVILLPQVGAVLNYFLWEGGPEWSFLALLWPTISSLVFRLILRNHSHWEAQVLREHLWHIVTIGAPLTVLLGVAILVSSFPSKLFAFAVAVSFSAAIFTIMFPFSGLINKRRLKY